MKLTQKEKRILLRDLPRRLCDRYGFSHYFPWKQVLKTVEAEYPELVSKVENVYALMCSVDEFESLAEMCSFSMSYIEIREELSLPSSNAIPFWKSGTGTGWVTLDEPNADAVNAANVID